MMTDAEMSELQSLIDKAERESKWLFCHYQSLWFSPERLREQIMGGRFRWGVVNWKLRDPKERIVELEQAKKRAGEELQRAYKEMT